LSLFDFRRAGTDRASLRDVPEALERTDMARVPPPLIAGNWKMFTDRASASRLAAAIGEAVGRETRVEVGLFPPFPFLAAVREVTDRLGYALGGQDLYVEAEGAFTGEVSGMMLRSVGCRYVLVGHSERRHILGEDDDFTARKLRAALAANLRPILCVGETLDERDAGSTVDVVRRQIETALLELEPRAIDAITLAYEPVWAIGTGRTATPEQAVEVHAEIRALLGKRFGTEATAQCRILYGGSVKPDNIEELMAREEIQGALVGGASLQAESFASIVRGAARRTG